MATTTPHYGWPVPTSTDYVKDGATAIEALGDAIDATVFGLGSAGLTLVNTTTFTASSTVSINNCFNSTYDNYKIILSITSASGSVDMFIRMRASGTDNTSSQYGYYNSNYPMGFAPSNSSASSASFMYTGTTDTTGLSSSIELYSPFIASKTMTTISAVNPAGVGYLLYNRMTVTNSYDGITFYPSSGNITGNIRIYGYKNS
jgi:hypothetical protein